MNGDAIARRLTDALGLETPPIALRFAEAAPAGVPQPATDAPSACAFWRRAEQGVFFAPAAAHYHCPVGTMTMGFALPDAVQQELMAAVGLMNEAGYLSPAEPAQMPSTGKGAAGIVYGPLVAFPLEPELVLLWLTPRQAMLLNEATGGAQWTAEPLAVRGRPACAALPLALSGARATLSLGCIGMRTFTEIADDRLLVVLPGQQVEAIAGALQAIAAANARMQQHYLQKKAAFAP